MKRAIALSLGVAASVTLAIGVFSLGEAATNKGAVLAKPVHPSSKPSTEAKTTVECPNGKTYTLSINNGTCKILRDEKNAVIGGLCENTKNDSVSTTCRLGCGTASGSGSCEVK